MTAGSPALTLPPVPGSGQLPGAAGARPRGHQGVRVQGVGLPQGRCGSLRAVVAHLWACVHTCVSSGIGQAKESLDQLVYVCRTDKEEVREAAKQTLLVLGEGVSRRVVTRRRTCRGV